MSYRIDAISIKCKVKRTDEGYLHGDAVITRVGVLVYKNADGSIRRELRHPDDVFNQDSLDTLKMVPITNKHPNSEVKSTNVKRLQIGMTGENVRHDERNVTNSIKITDSAAMSDIDRGRQELSAGYHCDMIKQAGTYNGEAYDERQTNIRYNHVAICEKGRAGAEARLNFDSIDGEDDVSFHMDEDSTSDSCSACGNEKISGACVNSACNQFVNKVDCKDSCHSTKERKLMNIKVDSCDYDVAQEVANHIGKLGSQISTLTGERDSLKVKCDSFEKRDFAKELKEAVAERRTLETSVQHILPDVKMNEMEDIDLMKAAITKQLPDLKLDADVDESFLRGAFTTAISFAQRKDSASSANRAKSAPVAANRKDSSDEEGKVGSSSARARYIENSQNAYKGAK
jgi:uncharacterized protein